MDITLYLICYKDYLIEEKMEIKSDVLCNIKIELFIVVVQKQKNIKSYNVNDEIYWRELMQEILEIIHMFKKLVLINFVLLSSSLFM